MKPRSRERGISKPMHLLHQSHSRMLVVRTIQLCLRTQSQISIPIPCQTSHFALTPNMRETTQKISLLKLATRDPENWDNPQLIANAASACSIKAPSLASVRSVCFFDADVCAWQYATQRVLFGEAPATVTGSSAVLCSLHRLNLKGLNLIQVLI